MMHKGGSDPLTTSARSVRCCIKGSFLHLQT